MRIVAGEARGRTIICPGGDQVRPTPERVREAVFSILGARLTTNPVVLDLFAGSGSLGLEALSRGAARAVFVERDRLVARTLAQNINRLGYGGSSRIIRRGVEAALPALIRRGEKFHLIFMDPPYGADLVPRVLGNRDGPARILEPGGLVVAEHGKGELGQDQVRLGKFTLIDRRTYGDTEVTFWSLEEAQ